MLLIIRYRTALLAAIVIATTVSPVRAADPSSVVEGSSFRAAIYPLLTSYCVGCHGPTMQKGKVRLDALSAPSAKLPAELTVWAAVYEQLDLAQMPPADSRQPTSDQLQIAKKELQAELARAGVLVGHSKAAEYPNKGNLVDHAKLFDDPSRAFPATPARLWRLSPYAYRRFADDLTQGRLIVQGGPAVRAKRTAIVTTPFGLTSDPGFRDYAFRYQVSGSESQQLAMNAKIILEGMLEKRPRFTPPHAFTAITTATMNPTTVEVQTAVRFTFEQVIDRGPTEEELQQFTEFVTSRIERYGNREGLILGLVPVFLHAEAVFRFEFGAGHPDNHGRLFLSPTELAIAISYALTDRRPDAVLLAAARSGRLGNRDDVRRELTRLLNDPHTEKPRILRFFREYFDYDKASEVFKDDSVLRAAQLARDGGAYKPETFVHDTDRLVEWVLAKDRDVLRELLTTDQSFVGYDQSQHWLSLRKQREMQAQKTGQPLSTHPFGPKFPVDQYYTFDVANWSPNMPLTLSANQRAGILTQPSWLIAHSANTENHAIHRGKWVRERLLGGSIPDTPITVEAKLPDEPHETLRHRMRVTREEYCFKCHRQMDPLGLPFEMFDHFGRFRAQEQGKPVDTSGEIVASGDPKLDGKVSNALELIRKLADSERVQQVFVRHAFRYWLGRNETLDDAPTLQAAYKAYQESHGSMNDLITALLTSDSFLYRRPETVAK